MSKKSPAIVFSTAVNCLMLIVSQNVGQQLPSTRLRRSPDTYEMDTLVVVDYKFWTNWILMNGRNDGNVDRNVKEYVSFLIREANFRLRNLKDRLPYSIAINPVDFRIGKDVLRGRSSNTNGQLHVKGALDTFKVWLSVNGLSEYDHALLISGYKFTDESNKDVAGRAYVGALCNPQNSVSVIHDKGGFQGARTLAHEIGHCLGANHDGEKGNTCRATDRYIMAADDKSARTPANEVNPWHFSTCSAIDINTFLSTHILGPRGINCLASTQPPAPSFAATANIMPGQRYELQTQCQMLHGLQSKPCVGGTFGDLSDICTSLYCLITDREPAGSCSKYVAAEGTTCGNKMWCRSGKCVTSLDAPELKDVPCPYGDSVVRINQQYSCSQWVQQQPNSCYDEQFQHQCCESCGRARNRSNACPWGDQRSGCTSDHCNRIDSDGTNLSQMCCETCGYLNAKQCSDATVIDGVSCDVRVKQRSYQHCYNSTVAFHCCDTCTAMRSSTTKGCEYGDHLLNCQASSADGTKSSVDDNKSCNKELCCETCASNAQRRRINVFSTVIATIVYTILT